MGACGLHQRARGLLEAELGHLDVATSHRTEADDLAAVTPFLWPGDRRDWS